MHYYISDSQDNVLLVSLFPNKVTSFDSVDLPESEDPKNVVRVGWSTDSVSLQLGTFTIIISPTVKFRK